MFSLRPGSRREGLHVISVNIVAANFLEYLLELQSTIHCANIEFSPNFLVSKIFRNVSFPWNFGRFTGKLCAICTFSQYFLSRIRFIQNQAPEFPFRIRLNQGILSCKSGFTYCQFRDVSRTPSNIYDETFCKNSYRF